MQVIRQRAHQRLDRFVEHQADAHRTRVLQARGEKANAADHPTQVGDVDLAEVVLTELTRQPLEADQGAHLLRPCLGNHGIKGGLAARVALAARAPQHLDRPQRRLLLQDRGHEFPETLDDAGPADRRGAPRPGVIDVRDVGLLGDSLDRSQRDPRLPGDLGPRVARLE